MNKIWFGGNGKSLAIGVATLDNVSVNNMWYQLSTSCASHIQNWLKERASDITI